MGQPERQTQIITKIKHEKIAPMEEAKQPTNTTDKSQNDQSHNKIDPPFENIVIAQKIICQ